MRPLTWNDASTSAVRREVLRALRFRHVSMAPVIMLLVFIEADVSFNTSPLRCLTLENHRCPTKSGTLGQKCATFPHSSASLQQLQGSLEWFKRRTPSTVFFRALLQGLMTIIMVITHSTSMDSISLFALVMIVRRDE